jgi:hypothetical protein
MLELFDLGACSGGKDTLKPGMAWSLCNVHKGRQSTSHSRNGTIMELKCYLERVGSGRD